MENVEVQKSKEQLVSEAGVILYQNLISSGLVEKIVEHSKHGVLPFSSDFYNNVSFGYEMGVGDFSNGIWVQPRISNSSGRGDVTIKLYRLDDEGTENEIWSNVTPIHKKALLESAIEYQMTKCRGELNSVAAMREGVEELTIKRIEEEANKRLKLLEDLKTALRENVFVEKISSEQASLGAQLKK